MADLIQHVNFEAPAILRKGPSLNNRRRDDRQPYLVADGTIESCILAFLHRPVATRQLYDILTAPQLPLVAATMDAQHIAELARFRGFLE